MSRQCPNHYAFRAGQNLPDKEFRYLRTVIVTAALTFQHWAGVSSYTSSFDFAETCVFAKQLLGPILCDQYCYWLPLSLSYGVNLPSSLTMLLSLAWKFSFFPPVSVYGTSTSMLLYHFSCHRIYLLRYYCFTPSFDTNFSICSLRLFLCVMIYCISHFGSAGIFYLLPIDYASSASP